MSITMESDFSEYVTALKKAGACGDVMTVHDKMLEENPKLKVSDVYKIFLTGVDEGWPFWALKIIGNELDESFRTAILTDLMKDPILCLKLNQECSFFTESEITLLKSKYEGKFNTTTVKEPMDAAMAYINCAPVLQKSDSLALKSLFEGKLPTVEKELRDGVVTRAVAEVKP